MSVRSLVVWFPDWPVTALVRTPGVDAKADEPLAVVHANTVVACSAAARSEGVRTGQRRRDAQARCPHLHIVPDDPQRDSRAFLPVVRRIEELAPEVQILRPGLCALRARGPARYYGGEDAAARMILDAMTDAGIPGVRAGVADGPFTAEQAARLPSRDPMRIVPPGHAAEFLAPLPVTVLGDDDLASLLGRLGVQTLGAFAAIDPMQVEGRLGPAGVRLRALAAGADSAPVTPRIPPPELAREAVFEPPLTLAEQVAFSIRTTADAVLEALAAASLVCTEVRVELSDEDGGGSERTWLHPACFTAADIVDRVRWQLQAALEQAVPDEEGSLVAGIVRVRIVPESVDAVAHHQPGLFGQGPDQRLHHALSRVQAMLGHRGVLVPAIGGGRWLDERQVLVPWGDRVVLRRERELPWPGSLPAPLPAIVFRPQPEAAITASDGTAIDVDDRGSLTDAPAFLTVAGARTAVASWAGPWPLVEREWDAQRRRRAHRFQVVDSRRTAWLLVLEDGHWSAEGRYD